MNTSATSAATEGAPPKAERYEIDIGNMHASIQFKISHLGFGWMIGRFNRFSGFFDYAEGHPELDRVSVTIETGSIDTNHPERDKHLRSKDFLAVEDYPEAHFVSTRYEETGEDSAILEGNLTLRGVTRLVRIEVLKLGHGKDPWDAYRRAFMGSTRLALKDFGIEYDLGPAAREVDLYLNIEGIRQAEAW
ncbi:MAG: YceI family protein [Pseudomonadota bacterium]